ncbi:hypothetical protein BBD39_05680 [Arsenophonus endosymbiont of Bemisia tabaci Asia II 3]|nr:hypothetical protein BBD39_05680 [Arsenophonus endosymbiont of Bemisia tabaci Asia II 3]
MGKELVCSRSLAQFAGVSTSCEQLTVMNVLPLEFHDCCLYLQRRSQRNTRNSAQQSRGWIDDVVKSSQSIVAGTMTRPDIEQIQKTDMAYRHGAKLDGRF